MNDWARMLEATDISSVDVLLRIFRRFYLGILHRFVSVHLNPGEAADLTTSDDKLQTIHEIPASFTRSRA